MKQTLNILLLLINFFSFAQVAIGTTAPSSAAVLHLQKKAYSTIVRGGFLMPVVTELEQASIPVVKADDGMQVFVSDPSTGKWCWDIYDAIESTKTSTVVWRSINCHPMNPPAVCTTQIYTENFGSYVNQTGIIGVNNVGDYPLGTPWIIDTSGSSMSGTKDWAMVNNGVFEIRDSGGPIILTLPSVDISAYATICFSVDLAGQGDLEYDPAQHSSDATNNINDYINVEYSINGGAWVVITNFGGNGTIHHTLVAPYPQNGTFPDSTVSETGLSGNTLQIRIRAQTWSDKEYFHFDNVIIEGGN